jgi:hypothetical protein
VREEAEDARENRPEMARAEIAAGQIGGEIQFDARRHANADQDHETHYAHAVAREHDRTAQHR